MLNTRSLSIALFFSTAATLAQAEEVDQSCWFDQADLNGSIFHGQPASETLSSVHEQTGTTLEGTIPLVNMSVRLCSSGEVVDQSFDRVDVNSVLRDPEMPDRVIEQFNRIWGIFEDIPCSETERAWINGSVDGGHPDYASEICPGNIIEEADPALLS